MELIKKENFVKYNQIYAPIISKLFVEDACFFSLFLNKTIKWGFVSNKDLQITASCSKSDDTISINLDAVVESDKTDHLMTIEYYLLHEIRHIYQHIKIRELDAGVLKKEDKERVKRWKSETNNYYRAVDNGGTYHLEEYFQQDIEIDAYAFSYAVMKYKYGNVDFLYIPERNTDEFWRQVGLWSLEIIKNEPYK